MVGLGNNVHVFAKPHRREGLERLFENLLGVPIASVEHPGMSEPMLIIRFPQGGALSIEFTPDAADSEEPQLAAWLELRSLEPEALMERLIRAGVRKVEHPGHPYYFMAPGGQVFTIAPATT